VRIDSIAAGRHADVVLQDSVQQGGDTRTGDIRVRVQTESPIYEVRHDTHFRIETGNRLLDPAAYTSGAGSAVESVYIFEQTRQLPVRDLGEFRRTGLLAFTVDFATSPYLIAGTAGLLAGSNIIVKDADGHAASGGLDPEANATASINFAGFTDLLDITFGYIDVNVDGQVTLVETVGNARIGLARSRLADVVVAAPDSILDGDDDERTDVAGGDIVLLSATEVADLIQPGGGPTQVVTTAGAVALTERSDPGGSIGTNENFLEIDSSNPVSGNSGLLTAEADGVIRITETAGDLNLERAVSTSDVTLAAESGSILDGRNDAQANIISVNVDLFATNDALISNSGGIGAADNDLEIDSGRYSAFSGRLYAQADGTNGGIYITETANELQVLQVKSASGDVRLTVPDTAQTPVHLSTGPDGITPEHSLGDPATTTDPAEDLFLLLDGGYLVAENDPVAVDEAEGAVISAGASVELLVGDNIVTLDNSNILAGTTIAIFGDYGNADAGWGTNMDLRGTITPGSPADNYFTAIFGNTDSDQIRFNQTLLGGMTRAYGSSGLPVVQTDLSKLSIAPSGEDFFIVDAIQTMTVSEGHTLTLDGQSGTGYRHA
jgi:hypothetical protein